MLALSGIRLLDIVSRTSAKGSSTVVAETAGCCAELALLNSVDLLALAERVSHEPKSEHDRATTLTLILSGVKVRDLLSVSHSELFIALVEKLVVPHISYANLFQGSEELLSALRDVFYAFTTACVSTKHYKTCWNTLRIALNFVPASHYLSPVHALLLQVALASGAVKESLEFLERITITEIDPAATGANLKDFISFYYYSGVLFAAAKRWGDSKLALESSFAVPNYGNNAIMVAAVKLYTLVSLIADGAVQPILNSRLERVAAIVCSEYRELAEAFEARNSVAVNELVVKYASVFYADQLDSLVHEAHSCFLKHSIRDLTKVYVSCSLNDIATEKHTTLDAVRSVLSAMIASGEVFGEISTEAPYTVQFRDVPSLAPEALNEAIERCKVVTKLIDQCHDDALASTGYALNQLRSNPRYSEIMSEHEKRKSSASQGQR